MCIPNWRPVGQAILILANRLCVVFAFLQVWYFPCGQWLDSTQGDQATRRCLKATHNFDPASLQCAYRVAVTTGNVRGAGTDANVFIMIHGSQGDTGRQLLAKTGRNCFERG